MLNDNLATLDFTSHPVSSRKSKVVGSFKITTAKNMQESVDSVSTYTDNSDTNNEYDDIENMYDVVDNDCIDVNYQDFPSQVRPKSIPRLEPNKPRKRKMEHELVAEKYTLPITQRVIGK